MAERENATVRGDGELVDVPGEARPWYLLRSKLQGREASGMLAALDHAARIYGLRPRFRAVQVEDEDGWAIIVKSKPMSRDRRLYMGVTLGWGFRDA